LAVVLYGCEMCSLTFMKDYTLYMFENKVLRQYLDLRRMKEVNNQGYYTAGTVVIYTGHLVSLR
jgi:hypothetical protein